MHNHSLKPVSILNPRLITHITHHKSCFLPLFALHFAWTGGAHCLIWPQKCRPSSQASRSGSRRESQLIYSLQFLGLTHSHAAPPLHLAGHSKVTVTSGFVGSLNEMLWEGGEACGT